MRVIPAIDVLDGRCVRLIQGDYQRRISYKGVAEAVAEFQGAGATELHMVDLEAARSGLGENFGLISSVIRDSGLEVQVGGGVRSMEVAQQFLDGGAARVVVGSSIVDAPDFFRELCARYPDRVVASLDYRRDGGERYIATHGWLDSSGVRLMEAFSIAIEMGCRRFLATDVSKDGTLEGPDLDTYREILTRFDVELIASGGVGSLQDIERLGAIDIGGRGLHGVVVGRALHDGKIDIREAFQIWRP